MRHPLLERAPYSEFPTREQIRNDAGEPGHRISGRLRILQYSNLGYRIGGRNRGSGLRVRTMPITSSKTYWSRSASNDTKPELPEEHKGGRLATGLFVHYARRRPERNAVFSSQRHRAGGGLSPRPW